MIGDIHGQKYYRDSLRGIMPCWAYYRDSLRGIMPCCAHYRGSLRGFMQSFLSETLEEKALQGNIQQ